MGFRYCVDIDIKKVKVPTKLAHKFLEEFKEGTLIDRFMAYLMMFRHLAMMMDKSLGYRPYYRSKLDSTSPIWELKQIICGRNIDVKVGSIENEPHIFFKPYENEYRCNQMGVILSALVSCCRVSDCKQCIDYAKKHMEKLFINALDYDVNLNFVIKRKTILNICLEVK